MMGIQLIGSPTGHANSWSTQKIQSRQGMKTALLCAFFNIMRNKIRMGCCYAFDVLSIES